jgi:hypothetical protein
LTGILEAGSSVNMYMFHGGTNFGFMSGANRFSGSTYKPDVTSYGMMLRKLLLLKKVKFAIVLNVICSHL